MDAKLKRLMEHGQNKVYLLSMTKPHKIVARGNVMSKCPTTKVGGICLDKLFWEVYIDIPIMPKEVLPRPYGCYKTIGDSAGATIAWPKFMVKMSNQSA